MPVPLPVLRCLIRMGIAQRLPSIRRFLGEGVHFLHYLSDAVLAAPNSEIASLDSLLLKQHSSCIDLSIGTPNPAGLQMHLEPIVSGFGDIEKHLFSGYPPASGIPELRQTFSNQLKHDQQLDYDPEKELLITNGVCQSITTALETFINRGDKVVLFDPSFMFYQYAVRCQGARVNWVPTFRIDGELFFEDIALKKAMRGASIIIINHPSNPTGGYFSDHSLQKIVYWAKRFDSLIFSDEVYHRFLYNGRKFHSIAAIPEARTRTLIANSLSKSYSMAGLRVGYLASNENLIRPLKSQQFLRVPFVSSLSQHLAIRCIENADPNLLIDHNELNRNRLQTYQCLQEMGLHEDLPAGAFYFWIDIGNFCSDAMTFCHNLLDENQLLVMPGTDFGPSGKTHVRISYSTDNHTLTRGLDRLSQFLVARDRPADSEISRRDTRHLSETHPIRRMIGSPTGS